MEELCCLNAKDLYEKLALLDKESAEWLKQFKNF